MSEQTIFRTKHADDFVILPNATLRDSRLSFKARGILAMILTNRDEWIVTSAWLEGQGTEGREAIRSATDELQAFGYAKFNREKARDGTFKNVWCFFDTPQEVEPMTGSRHSGNRRRETVAGNPSHSQKEQADKPSKNKKTEFPKIPEKLRTPEFEAAWERWLEDRKTRRKPVTPLAAELQFKKLESWGVKNAIAAINEAIEKNWQSFWEQKQNRKPVAAPLHVFTGNEPTLPQWEGVPSTIEEVEAEQRARENRKLAKQPATELNFATI